YESVTGRLPFEGETFNDLMFNIALNDPTPALKIVPSLDLDFVWLIERAMAKAPGDRFQTVKEFAEALDEWMRKNALTSTLMQPLPSDAFPMRESASKMAAATPIDVVPSSGGRVDRAQMASAPTLVGDGNDPIALKATAAESSWAQSKGDVPAK